MANDIKLYDTVKDKKGNRFRVTEMSGEGGHVIASLKGINGDGTMKRGMPRRVAVDELEKKYTRVNLPEVAVRKIDDLSEGKHANAEEPALKAKPAQIEEQTVRALSEEEVEEALTASTFGGIEFMPADEKDSSVNGLKGEIEKLEKANRELQRNLDVVCDECIDLKEENETLHAKLTNETQEIIDLKKTISKMQQEHAVEVADLKDRLMEKEAECNAIRKSKDEILKERTKYADALDNDSVAFEAILDLAHIAQSVSQSLYKVSKRIEAETEGRI